MKTVQTRRLYEKFAQQSIGRNQRVDRALNIIRGVKVMGFESLNTGRTLGLDARDFGDAVNKPYLYDRHAVQRALPLYEGVTVRMDHPEFSYKADGTRVFSRKDRKVGETFGRLINCRLAESGMFADLEYLSSHPLSEMTIETAERMPEQIALSHAIDFVPALRNGRVVIDV